MIGDIANTPIPTLLVVAGIIFLFLALGGSLGATIGAERLKPLPSTIVGVVLLGLGVGLYQTHGSQITPGQPPDKPANPERQEHTTPDKPANPEQQEHTTPVDLAALLESVLKVSVSRPTTAASDGY